MARALDNTVLPGLLLGDPKSEPTRWREVSSGKHRTGNDPTHGLQILLYKPQAIKLIGTARGRRGAENDLYLVCDCFCLPSLH